MLFTIRHLIIHFIHKNRTIHSSRLHRSTARPPPSRSSTRTPSTSAMHTLHHSALLQLRLGHPAYAVRSEVRVSRLDASQAAQILVARFLPFGDQICVGDLFAHTIVVELPADGLASIEQIVDVSGLLMVDLENGPERFADAFPFVRIGFG